MIDYKRANREGPALKAALTRATKSKDAGAVVLAVRKALKAWRVWGAWPDQWHRWNIALGDAIGWNVTIDDLDGMSDQDVAALVRELRAQEG